MLLRDASRRLGPVLAIAAALTSGAFAATATGTQNLNLTLGPLSKVAVLQSSVNLAHAGTIFANFNGSITVQYEVRTTVSTGNGVLTVKAATDFSPANGPRIAGGDLTYTCAGATLGNACSGAQTVSTTSQGSVVNVGSGACTGAGCAGANPNSVTLNMTLVDSPVFKTGNYSTNLTFSISSL